MTHELSTLLKLQVEVQNFNTGPMIKQCRGNKDTNISPHPTELENLNTVIDLIPPPNRSAVSFDVVCLGTLLVPNVQ